MDTVASQIGIELKNALNELYGSRLSGLILFGSYANGNFTAESDIDFAVILHDDTFSPASEIFRITPYSTPIGIRHNVPVSILPVSNKRLTSSQLAIYKTIRKEGVSI